MILSFADIKSANLISTIGHYRFVTTYTTIITQPKQNYNKYF
nr:MAG TPA: hypothetical protein [Caudoviricetes sp.]